jgi:hypothetical protein
VRFVVSQGREAIWSQFAWQRPEPRILRGVNDENLDVDTSQPISGYVLQSKESENTGEESSWAVVARPDVEQ